MCFRERTARDPAADAILLSHGKPMTDFREDALLARITVNPEVFGGKPITGNARPA